MTTKEVTMNMKGTTNMQKKSQIKQDKTPFQVETCPLIWQNYI